MKILLLTQWFDPEPTFKGLAFAKELKRQGHDVQVLTGFPNYPGGKIYDGYKLKLYQREEVDGISILRVALYPNHDSSALKRIFNYISFAFMAILFGIFATRKADVIYNWCDEQGLTQAKPAKLEYRQLMQNKFNIVFAGNMGKAQALDIILEVAKNLQDLPDIQFVFVGGGTETDHLKQRSIIEGIPNAIFIPRMPMAEVGGVLELSSLLLVHLKKDPLFEITVPSKTQAYMAMGKPILMAVAGDAAELVQKAQCGCIAISEDAASIQQAILEIYQLPASEQQKMGINARNFYIQELSLESGVKQFVSIFEKVKHD